MPGGSAEPSPTRAARDAPQLRCGIPEAAALNGTARPGAVIHIKDDISRRDKSARLVITRTEPEQLGTLLRFQLRRRSPPARWQLLADVRICRCERVARAYVYVRPAMLTHS